MGRVCALWGLLAALWVWPAAADPAVWRVDPAGSAIEFGYTLWGSPREGRFKRFGGRARLDLKAPERATFVLRIASGSIDLGNRVFSALATSSEWFDTKNHPQLVYRLESMAPLEGNLYRAVGTLTIRGHEERTESVMTLVSSAEHLSLSGALTINRRPYGLGVGIGEFFVDVADEVAVRFLLLARREGG